MVRKCKNCGSPYETSQGFCPECGTPAGNPGLGALIASFFLGLIGSYLALFWFTGTAIALEGLFAREDGFINAFSLLMMFSVLMPSVAAGSLCAWGLQRNLTAHSRGCRNIGQKLCLGLNVIGLLMTLFNLGAFWFSLFSLWL